MSLCPDADTLGGLLNEELSAARAAQVVAHVDDCLRCQVALDRATRDEVRSVPGLLGLPAPTLGPHERASLLGQMSGPRNVTDERQTGGRPARPPAPPGYEIGHEIGRGGAAVVYRARHLGLNRDVALKMLHAGVLSDGVRSARLQQEGQAIARLTHPNIVQVYDIGEQAGRPFLALELIEGDTLARWTGGAPCDPREAAAIVSAVADAVEYAHQNGILHRDLKPANILLAPPAGGERTGLAGSGVRPKVADFGLALIQSHAAAPAPLTQDGAILGTPSYMAPEQALADGAGVTPATDVYALGAVLYELLTTRPPFRAQTPLQTLLEVVHDEIVPVSRLRRLPRDLATICMKCLEKNPARRYQRAADLADDLRRFLAHEPIRARPVGVAGAVARWTRRRPAVAALLLTAAATVVAAFVVVSWMWQRAEAARLRAEELAAAEAAAQAAVLAERDAVVIARRRAERTAAELILDQSVELCERGDINRGLAGFARGLQQATDGGFDDMQFVFRANLAAWASRRLTPATSSPLGASATSVAYSPDGRRVLVGQWANKFNKRGPGEARVYDPNRWQPLGPPLTHDGPVTSVAYSPDGQRLLTGSSDGSVSLWDAATGDAVGGPIRELKSVAAVAFAPDSRTFVAAGLARSPDPSGEARVWDVDGLKLACPPIPHPGPVFAVAYNRDGALLTGCQASGGLAVGGQARVWDPRTGKPAGPVLMHSGAVRAVAFNPSGQIALTGCDDRTTVLWNRATGRRIGSPHVHPHAVHAVAFAPDGITIVTGGGPADSSVQGDRARLWDALTGKPLSGPLFHPDAVHAVAVRPDGRQVVTACRDGYARAWEVSDLRPRLEHVYQQHFNALAFSGDGRRVAVGGRTPIGGGTVRAWDVTTDQPSGSRITHPAPVDSLAFAPDGAVLAVGGQDGSVRLWDNDGRAVGRPLAHADGVESLEFSSDGRLLLSRTWNGTARLWEVETGRLAWDGQSDTRQARAAALSPDARVLLAAEADDTVRLWDVATGRPTLTFSASPHTVRATAFDTSGRLALTGCVGGTARLWDATTGRPLGPAMEHPNEVVWSVGFTADPRRVYTVAGTPYRDFGYVRLWDPVSGALLSRLPDRVAVRAVAFCRETGVIATAAWGGDARVWDVRTGRAIGPRLPSAGTTRSLGFSPDGCSLAVASEDGTLQLWPVPQPVAGTVDAVLRQFAVLEER